MAVLTIIQLILPILTNLLSSNGVISQSLSNLITQLGAAVPALISSLFSGKGATADILPILQAIQAEVNVLKANNVLLTLNEANEINALDSALQKALAAYSAAQGKTDPSNLTPLPEAL